jgi:hypothetical protein
VFRIESPKNRGDREAVAEKVVAVTFLKRDTDFEICTVPDKEKG